MALAVKGLLQVRWLPRCEIVRYKKINIQRPFPPHFEKRKVIHITQPILPMTKKTDPTTPQYEICNIALGIEPFYKLKKEKQAQEVHPYETILARELLNWLEHSKMIAFLHKSSMSMLDLYEIRLQLKKNNMHYKKYHPRVVRTAVTGTFYESILVLFDCTCTAIVCSEETNVSALLKTLKRTPKLDLMAAVIDGRFLSRSQLEHFAMLPDLQTTRSCLVSVLNMTQQHLVNNLNQHQSTLVQHLQRHVELSQSSSPKVAANEPEPSGVTDSSGSSNKTEAT